VAWDDIQNNNMVVLAEVEILNLYLIKKVDEDLKEINL
jgi:hypothetical protein